MPTLSDADKALVASALGSDTAEDVAASSKNLVEATVEKLPDCDVCKHHFSRTTVAAYDAYIPAVGQWGYVCESHFSSCGCKLGTGRGQKLVLPKPKSAPFTVGAVVEHTNLYRNMGPGSDE